ncbi:MAG TPA: heme exporter protein CcmB [Fimbriimonadaceae bacterium]|nr:heme exporter protein CcmB [Fimbriimonadaceae bacterium]
MAEIWTVFRKEWRGEMRSRHGIFTAGLFSLLAVVAIAFASYGQKPSGTILAGMLCITLLFASVMALPRTFLVEDEQGTFDLLRLISEPQPVFVGKTLYNLTQMLVTGFVLAILLIGFAGLQVTVVWLYILALVAECMALAGAVSLCGALAIGAANRWILAAVLSVPLLLPQVAMGVGAFRAALGEGTIAGGTQNVLGLLGFGVAALALGPVLAASVWKTE